LGAGFQEISAAMEAALDRNSSGRTRLQLERAIHANEAFSFFLALYANERTSHGLLLFVMKRTGNSDAISESENRK